MNKEEKYNLVGIDPGTNLMGFAVIEVNKKKMRLVEMGVIKLSLLETQDKKLKKIFERVQVIIKTYKPAAVAIEAPFFGKNVQAMLKLGRAQGVAIAAAATLDVPVTEYAPRKIKQSVTGKGNASKEQVSAMLANIFKINLDEQYLDATDALGAAACHYYQNRNPLLKGKKYNSWAAYVKDNPKRKD